MGRVYNALVKAERWKDRQRPIGRPVTTVAERAHLRAEQSQSKEARPQVAQAAYRTGEDRASQERMREEAANLSSYGIKDEATAAPVGFDESFALAASLFQSQVIAAPAPVAPAQVATRPAEASELRAAPAPAPATPFEEARKIVNARNLKIDPHLTAYTGGDVLASERYRTLAVRIINLAARRKLKTIVVTSAQESEGKSTIATNLAWVMSKRADRRVMLIDADLRNPSVGRMLGLETERGWLDIIEGSSKLVETMVRLEPNGLYVMTPKSARESKRDLAATTEISDAVTSSRVEQMIKELEEHFDFIVIDAPPILEFADAQRLASIVDGTVLVAKAGHTHHAAVTDALKLVSKERRLGVVLNQSQLDEEIPYNKQLRKPLLARLLKRGR
jgi:capsular exopolysaccharide synthesis family protein